MVYFNLTHGSIQKRCVMRFSFICNSIFFQAERNVLPVLNNLLENREMHLEDGRLLIPAARYDKLLEEHTQEELDK